MKKTLIVLLTIILCTTMFAGCAQTNSVNNETDVTQSEQKKLYGTPIKTQSIEVTSVNVGDEIVTATFTVAHEEQIQTNREFVKKLNKSLRKKYVETFAEQFPNGLSVYEEMNTYKLTKDSKTYIAITGRMNEGYFLALYQVPEKTQEQPAFTTSSIDFTYEFTGSSAKIDEILQQYQHVTNK